MPCFCQCPAVPFSKCQSALPPPFSRVPSYPAPAPTPPTFSSQSPQRTDWQRLIQPNTSCCKVIRDVRACQEAPSNHHRHVTCVPQPKRHLLSQPCTLHPPTKRFLCNNPYRLQHEKHKSPTYRPRIPQRRIRRTSMQSPTTCKSDQNSQNHPSLALPLPSHDATCELSSLLKGITEELMPPSAPEPCYAFLPHLARRAEVGRI